MLRLPSKLEENDHEIKLVLFDPVTKQHQLFEKVDPIIGCYEFDPKDISCIKTPEGKNLIALARGSDIFMIDLNV